MIKNFYRIAKKTFAGPVLTLSLFFAPIFFTAAFANPVYTYYDGVTYPGDEGPANEGTKINASHDNVAGGLLNENIMMTGGSLKLYSDVQVMGTINSNSSGEYELRFEEDYTLGGDIGGNNHYFDTTSLQNAADVSLNGNSLHVKKLYLNSGTISGNGGVFVHSGGFIQGFANSVSSQINGANQGVGEIRFITTNNDLKSIQNDIGQIKRLDNIVIVENESFTNNVSFAGYNVAANTITIEAGSSLDLEGLYDNDLSQYLERVVSGDIVVSADGVLNVGNSVSFDNILGATDGVGVVNFDGGSIYANGNIGTSQKSLSSIALLEDAELHIDSGFGIDATSIILSEGSSIQIDGGTIVGEIDGEGLDINDNGVGSIYVVGDFSTGGEIGANVAIDEINVIENATLTINHNINARTIHVAENLASTIDFTDTSRIIDANVYVSSSFDASNVNFGSGQHQFYQNFYAGSGNILSFKFNQSDKLGSLNVAGNVEIDPFVLLKIDISGFSPPPVAAGNHTLIYAGTSSDISEDISLNIGGGSTNNAFGNILFGTSVVDGDLVLTLSDNTDIFEVADNQTLTAEASIEEAALVIGQNATLNLGVFSINNANTIIGANSILNIGVNNAENPVFINGFISGAGTNQGTVNIKQSFQSSGDFGYVFALNEVNFEALPGEGGIEIDLRTNNNSITASLVNMVGNVDMDIGSGNINADVVFERNSDLYFHDIGQVYGTIDGFGELRFQDFGGDEERFVHGDIGQNEALESIQLGSVFLNGNSNVLNFNGFNVATLNGIEIGGGAVLNTGESGTIDSDISFDNFGDNQNGQDIDGVLNIGSNTIINGNITTGEDERGVVNINGDFSLSRGHDMGKYGPTGKKLASINVAAGVDFSLNNQVAAAVEINLNENANIDLEGGVLAGDVYLGLGSVITTEDNSVIIGDIDGTENGLGTLRINGRNSQIIGDIGGDDKINLIEVGDGAVFSINGDVYANSMIVNGGTVDFEGYLFNDEGTISVDISSTGAPVTFDFGVLNQTIDGKFSVADDDILAFAIGEDDPLIDGDGWGSVTVNSDSSISVDVKLNLDISTIDIASIVLPGGDNPQTTHALFTAAGEIKSISAIASEDITIGGVGNLSGSNAYGAINFETTVIGNELVLTFSENTDIFTVADNAEETLSENITQKAVIVGQNATLNLDEYNVTKANIIIKDNAKLYVGLGEINGFISGNSDDEGDLIITEDFVSNGNIGYVHHLDDVDVESGKTLNLFTNNNSLNSDDIYIADGAKIITGFANVEGNFWIRDEGSLEVNSRIIRGDINGGFGFADEDSRGKGNVVFFGSDNGETSIEGNIGQESQLGSITLSGSDRFESSGDRAAINFNGDYISAKYIYIENTASLSLAEESTIRGDMFIEGANTETGEPHGILNIGEGVNIYGDIEGDSNGDGIVNIGGNFSIISGYSLGNLGASLAEINVEENSALNAVSGSTIRAANITLAENAVLSIYDQASVTAAIDSIEDGDGTLEIFGDFTTAGEIGANNLLNLINVNEGAKLTLNDNIGAYNIVAKSATIDFANDSRVVDGNIYSDNVSDGSTFNFGSGDHEVRGDFSAVSGDIIAFDVNHSSQGSLDLESYTASIADGVKLNLDISGFDRSAISFAEGEETTFILINTTSENNVAVTAINGINLNIGGGSSSNIYGNLQFNTTTNDNDDDDLNGDNLVLTFSENTDILTIADTQTLNAEANIEEAAVIIGNNAALNLGTHNIENANIIIGAGSTLSTGSGVINGFISGAEANQGSVVIAGVENNVDSDTFVSNGDFGYVFSLSQVVVESTAVLNIATNNNSITASSLILEDNSRLRMGTGSINSAITLGANAVLEGLGAGRINAAINGSSAGNGDIILNVGGIEFGANIGSTNKINNFVIVDLDANNDAEDNTFDIIDISLSAKDFKIGSNAIVNITDSTLNIDRIIETSVDLEGVYSENQQLNITNSTLNFVDSDGIVLAKNSTINIGEGAVINGNINQLYYDQNEEPILGNGTININADFVSNGNFYGNNGSINISEDSSLNIAQNNNTISGYDVYLGIDSSLTVGSGDLDINIESAYDEEEFTASGTLFVGGAYDEDEETGYVQANRDIGSNNHRLESVEINEGALLKVAYTSVYADDIFVNGTLELTENHGYLGRDVNDAENRLLSGDIFVSATGVIDIGSTAQEISGKLTMEAGSSLNVNIAQIGDSQNNDYGNIDSFDRYSYIVNDEPTNAVNRYLVTINNGVKLNIDVSLADFTLEREFFLISGDVDSQINQILAGDISINGTGSNDFGLFRFATEVFQDGGPFGEYAGLKLIVTEITDYLDIYAADADNYDYTGLDTNIEGFISVNLMDSGATLSMGMGDVNTDINLSTGSVLNTGSGEINGVIAARTANSQGTVNIRDLRQDGGEEFAGEGGGFTLSANIGAANRAINTINIEENAYLDTNGHDIIATNINVRSSADLDITSAEVFDDEDATTFSSIAANAAGTLSTNISVEEGGVINIYNTGTDSINATVNGDVAGVGTINFYEDAYLSNLSIGQTNAIDQVNVFDSNVSLGSSLAANNIVVQEAALTMLDGTTTTLEDRLTFNEGNGEFSSIFYLGDHEGEGATLNSDVNINYDEAHFYVNANSIVNGDIVFTGNGAIHLEAGTILNGSITSKEDYADTTFGGLNGSVNVNGSATITGDVLGINAFSVGSNATFDIDSITILTNLLDLYDNSTTTNSGNLEIGVQGNEFDEGSGGVVTIAQGAVLASSGRISGARVHGEGFHNAQIRLGEDSILRLQYGSSLHASVNGISTGQGKIEIESSESGATSIDLYGDIGSVNQVAEIEIKDSSILNADGYNIYTDTLSVGQNANLNAATLHASNITIDTNNIETGITAQDAQAVIMNLADVSSLTLTSGLITTALQNSVVEVNNDNETQTTVTVGQDALEEGDSAAIISGFNRVIYADDAEGTDLIIDIKATGTVISTGEERTTIKLEEDGAPSTLTLTNAGTIESNGGLAIDSEFNSTITNSGTILGDVYVNAPAQATIFNTGTITGDIDIANSNDESYIEANGGTITGDIYISQDQEIFFDGGTLNGNVYGTQNGESYFGSVEIDRATFSQATTTINAAVFRTNANSSLSLTLSSPSITSLEVAGNAIIASSTTLHLTISGEIADGEHYTLISAADLTGGNISTSRIRINGANQNYNGKAFGVVAVDNELRLVITGDAQDPILRTQNPGAQNSFNNIIAIDNPTGNLATIQEILLDNNISESAKEEIAKSVTPQTDNGVNRSSFNLANSSVNMATGRVDTLRNGIASGDESVNRRMWGEAFGNSTKQKSSASSSGYNLNAQGFAIGGDKEISRDNYLGANVSYADSSVKSRGEAKSIQAKTYQLNLYGTTNFENFFIDAVAGFAWNDYTAHRSLKTVGDNAKADYSGQTYISKVKAGSVINLPNNFIFTPELAITAAHNIVDSYTEKGAENANLQVRKSTANFLETRAGFSLSHRSNIAGNIVIPQFRLSYGHDFAATRQKSTANFVGQSTTFQSQGDEIIRGSTKIGFGLKVYSKGTTTVSADYDAELKSGYRADAGTLRVTYGF